MVQAEILDPIEEFRGECRLFKETSLDNTAKRYVDDNINPDRKEPLPKKAALFWDLAFHVADQSITELAADTKNDPIFTRIAKNGLKKSGRLVQDNSKTYIDPFDSEIGDINFSHAMDYVERVLEGLKDKNDLIRNRIDEIRPDAELPIAMQIKKAVDPFEIPRPPSHVLDDFRKFRDALERQGTFLEKFGDKARAEKKREMDRLLVKDIEFIEKGLSTLTAVASSSKGGTATTKEWKYCARL